MDLSKQLFKIAKSKLGDLIVGIAFGKMGKLLPVKRIIETDRVIAFWHPKPSYEKHILIVPKRAIKTVSLINNTDSKYISDCYLVAKEVVVKLDLEKEGYSITTNGGTRQEVNQIHFHLYSGNKI